MFVMVPSGDWARCHAMRVREGPWLAACRLFQASGSEPVNTAPPDF